MDESTNQEKVLFVGILCIITSIISIWFAHLNNTSDYEDTYEPIATSFEYDKPQYSNPYTQRDTIYIRVQQPSTYRLNRFKRIENDLDRYIEDYLEDNPDIIEQYLD